MKPNTLYYISISSSAVDEEEMATMLRQIADQIEKGVHKGFYPTWELTEEPEHIED